MPKQTKKKRRPCVRWIIKFDSGEFGWSLYDTKKSAGRVYGSQLRTNKWKAVKVELVEVKP